MSPASIVVKGARVHNDRFGSSLFEHMIEIPKKQSALDFVKLSVLFVQRTVGVYQADNFEVFGVLFAVKEPVQVAKHHSDDPQSNARWLVFRSDRSRTDGNRNAKKETEEKSVHLFGVM